MAFINCSECSKEVSDKAAACPNCEVSIYEASKIIKHPKKIKIIPILIAAVVIFGSVGSVISCNVHTENLRIAEEQRLEEERIAEEQRLEEDRITDKLKADEKRITDEPKAEEERIADEQKSEEERKRYSEEQYFLTITNIYKSIIHQNDAIQIFLQMVSNDWVMTKVFNFEFWKDSHYNSYYPVQGLETMQQDIMEVKLKFDDLQNPSELFHDVYDALSIMYDAYVQIYGLANSRKESLNEFNEKRNELESNFRAAEADTRKALQFLPIEDINITLLEEQYSLTIIKISKSIINKNDNLQRFLRRIANSWDMTSSIYFEYWKDYYYISYSTVKGLEMMQQDIMEVKLKLDDLQNPSELFYDAYDALSIMYDTYVQICGLANSPPESFNEFNEKRNALISNFRVAEADTRKALQFLPLEDISIPLLNEDELLILEALKIALWNFKDPYFYRLIGTSQYLLGDVEIEVSINNSLEESKTEFYMLGLVDAEGVQKGSLRETNLAVSTRVNKNNYNIDVINEALKAYLNTIIG